MVSPVSRGIRVIGGHQDCLTDCLACRIESVYPFHCGGNARRVVFVLSMGACTLVMARVRVGHYWTCVREPPLPTVMAGMPQVFLELLDATRAGHDQVLAVSFGLESVVVNLMVLEYSCHQ